MSLIASKVSGIVGSGLVSNIFSYCGKLQSPDSWDMFAYEKTEAYDPRQDKGTPVFVLYGVKQV